MRLLQLLLVVRATCAPAGPTSEADPRQLDAELHGNMLSPQDEEVVLGPAQSRTADEMLIGHVMYTATGQEEGSTSSQPPDGPVHSPPSGLDTAAIIRDWEASWGPREAWATTMAPRDLANRVVCRVWATRHGAASAAGTFIPPLATGTESRGAEAEGERPECLEQRLGRLIARIGAIVRSQGWPWPWSWGRVYASEWEPAGLGRSGASNGQLPRPEAETEQGRVRYGDCQAAADFLERPGSMEAFLKAIEVKRDAASWRGSLQGWNKAQPAPQGPRLGRRSRQSATPTSQLDTSTRRISARALQSKEGPSDSGSSEETSTHSSADKIQHAGIVIGYQVLSQHMDTVYLGGSGGWRSVPRNLFVSSPLGHGAVVMRDSSSVWPRDFGHGPRMPAHIHYDNRLCKVWADPAAVAAVTKMVIPKEVIGKRFSAADAPDRTQGRITRYIEQMQPSWEASRTVRLAEYSWEGPDDKPYRGRQITIPSSLFHDRPGGLGIGLECRYADDFELDGAGAAAVTAWLQEPGLPDPGSRTVSEMWRMNLFDGSSAIVPSAAKAPVSPVKKVPYTSITHPGPARSSGLGRLWHRLARLSGQ